MRYSLLAAAFLSTAALFATAKESQNEENIEIIANPPASTINISCPGNNCKDKEIQKYYNNPMMPLGSKEMFLDKNRPLLINVVGQGVAPVNTASPAQAYALAKRAATADAYRLIAEKVKGVHVEGQDFVQNMMVKRSTVRTSVSAMIKNANVVDTTFKEGLCEVEMEITLSHSQFPQ